MHEAAVLGRHGQEDLFERVRIVVDHYENTTEVGGKVVEESPVCVRFDTVDQERKIGGQFHERLTTGCY